MRRHHYGGTTRRGRLRVLPVVGAVLAATLGVAAVWLIVTAHSAKWAQVGALLGFWALLLAAYPVLGTRSPRVVEAGQELNLRPSGPLERLEDAAERREYELRLQQTIAHQIHTVLGSELANLRSEVAALRTEILEKVGGQIRLERIETTRLIGSDIEALQDEVRQLNTVRQPVDFASFTVDAVSAFAQSAEDTSARQHPVASPQHAGDPQRIDHVEPITALEEVDGEDASGAPREPATAPAESGTHTEPETTLLGAGTVPDPFAAMPRITPFTEFALDEPDDRGDGGAEAGYAGRRRQGAEAAAAHVPAGRHAGDEAEWASAKPSGGRRRREDEDDDVLARILRREGIRG